MNLLPKLTSAGMVFVAFMPGCASGIGSGGFPADRVSKLVDEMTKSEIRQEKALRELQALGNQAVPYIVGNLNDTRPLAKAKMSLANETPGAFEGRRHYSPNAVHDALAAVLNQLTGENFVFVYNGATQQERESNRRKWVGWCQEKFPTQAAICSGQ